METVCSPNSCTGCCACVSICSKNAIQIEDKPDAMNAVIDKSKCVNCGRCKLVCPNIIIVKKKKPIKWYEGWAQENQIRFTSSSGGFASAIIKAFLEEGGTCYSCVFENGSFSYTKVTDYRECQGSKYVKVLPGKVFRDVLNDLNKGNKVLFIGLPCHVAGAINYTHNHANLYTIDLICHGSPSISFLSKFLMQYNTSISDLSNIKFRVKDFDLIEGYHKFSSTGIEDYYTFAFLKGLIYTDNCYSCAYAGIERCADITIGDSWGTKYADDELKKGISLALCMSEKGEFLLLNSGLYVTEPDVKSAIHSNKQLQHPTICPQQRKKMLRKIKKSSFNTAVRSCYPWIWTKQFFKMLLFYVKVWHSKELSFKIFTENRYKGDRDE